MLVRLVLFFPFILAMFAGISGCSATRQIRIESLSSESSTLEPLPGFSSIDGDDYYVQLISDFDFTGNQALEDSCGDIVPTYDNGAFSATLLFRIQNEALKLNREASGFLYQASAGQCNFSFDAQKTYLTPWMRLDSSQETLINYSFLTSENSDVNLSKLSGDLNTASNLLAFTGVGTGFAMIGKLASYWMVSAENVSGSEQNTTIAESILHHVLSETQATNGSEKQASTSSMNGAPQKSGAGSPESSANPPEAKRRFESHSLPAAVSFAGNSGNLNEARFKVYEINQGRLRMFGPDLRLLGTLKVYAAVLPSLLLKISPSGLPDASDLSLEELWHSKIRVGEANVDLKQVISSAQSNGLPNLQPDWRKYEDSESNCRQLKVLLKDLGFNKFDRNAILYYFLNNSTDWKNYNGTGSGGVLDEFDLSQFEKNREKNFGKCLSAEDYRTMKRMGLAVKTSEDWNTLTESGQKKIKFLGPLQSIERQLVPVIKNHNPDEMERQAFPLLATKSAGQGTVLLQNHLADFGLEKILEIPRIPGEGIVIDALQLSKVLNALKIAELSCARPAMDQRKPLKNIGIVLFITQDGSPIDSGGALEFEFNGGIISRLTLQHPTFRDFKQSLEDFADIGGCRIGAKFTEILF